MNYRTYGIHTKKMRISGNGLRWQQALWIAQERARVQTQNEARQADEFDRRWDARQAQRTAKSEAASARIEAANGDWRQMPATARQIAYLRDLNVALTAEQTSSLSRGRASKIIDAVKCGDSVGQFGLFMADGSN